MPPQKLNPRGSKQELEELIEVLELSELQKHFLRSRWLEQVSWMGRRSKKTRDCYYGLRLTTIIGGIIVPILIGLNAGDKNLDEKSIRWFTIGLSGIVAVSSAVEEFFNYGDRWRHYRRTGESLKSQGWQFSQLSGFYKSHKSHRDAFPDFADRVETILQQDVEVYVTEVVREKEKETGGDRVQISGEENPPSKDE